jgi:hypothetical protein
MGKYGYRYLGSFLAVVAGWRQNAKS